ncbi:MAG: hypothetical protein FWG32_06540 [Oscillospiraceae bacterium]|nr:hypothetical protein [Oscillospiraceae bacterium]
MPNPRRYRLLLIICIVLFLAEFYFFGNAAQFTAAYFAAFIFLTLRALSISSKKRMKLLMIVSYFALSAIQISFAGPVTSGNDIINPAKLFGVLSMAFPFAAERFFIVNKNASFYFPSVQELTTVTFNELKRRTGKISEYAGDIKKTGSALSFDNLVNTASDLQRHSSFRYINNGSLTEEYFKTASDSLNDNNIYIVVSDTGSAASEIISVFTKKQYNHASLSFDADLKTIISYNGGDRLYPPGLNPELIEFFNKKQDACIIVYRLEATEAQKRLILDKVREINNTGSAYNILGLMLKYSHKSNIMFCSQFVYKMLKCAGLEYFKKDEAEVRPMDFVELDVYRKLRFAYEITFEP